MKIFENLKKAVRFLYEGAELASVIHTGAEIASGELGGGKTEKTGKKSNMFGLGVDDEVNCFMAYWNVIPEIRKIVPNDRRHKGEVNKMVEVIRSLPEAAKSKIVLIFGRNAATVTTDIKENPSGEKREWEERWDPKAKMQIRKEVITKELIVNKVMSNPDGAKIIQVFIYFLRNGGPKELEAILRAGIISEPAKRIEEAIDATGRVIEHALGLNQEKRNEIGDKLDDMILKAKLKSAEKTARRLKII